MPKPAIDFMALIRELTLHRVDFIVVGGVGAVLHGSPIATFDLDLVHSRKPDNLVRLMGALRMLNAYYREQPERRLVPTIENLAGPGHHLLMTHAGPLDLLGALIGGRNYEDLLSDCVEMNLSLEFPIRVLNLPTLIALKEELGRPKDIATLILLRNTLNEQTRGPDGQSSV